MCNITSMVQPTMSVDPPDNCIFEVENERVLLQANTFRTQTGYDGVAFCNICLSSKACLCQSLCTKKGIM